MKRKPVPEIAARIAELSGKVPGGVFVFATQDADLPNLENASAAIAEYQFAGHQCKSCSTVFSAVKAQGLHNHCVTCGSDKVDVTANTKPTIPPDDQLSFLTCAGCGTINTFQIALAKVKGMHSIHCTVCGNAMSKTTADFDDMPEVDDLELVEFEDADLELGPDMDFDSDLMDQEVVSPDPEDESILDSDSVTDPIGVDTIDMDMVDLVEDDFDLAQLSVVYNKDKLSLAYADKLIAYLSAEKAGDYASILQTDEFRKSIVHSLRTLGLKPALANYKFTHVTVPVPVSKVLKKQVDAAVTQETSTLNNTIKTYEEQFQHAVDIAVAGYAGNYWKNKVDPIKAAFVTELATIGIRNPTKLVDRVFATHGVAQLREILAMARSLAKENTETLNGLASAIDLVKYQPTRLIAETEDEGEGEGEDEDTEDEDDAEEAVVSIGTPVETASNKNPSPYKNEVVRSILGSGSLFN